jgi:hypothetical protein
MGTPCDALAADDGGAGVVACQILAELPLYAAAAPLELAAR